MNKSEWKKRITKACKKAGTYQRFFEPIIETLAETMANRDDVAEYYERTGSNPIVRHTNKAGAQNPEKNPALLLWDDLNKSALAYWRDLGLTPAGLRKLNEDMPQNKTIVSALDKTLADLSAEL